jgi:hypothetical protein
MRGPILGILTQDLAALGVGDSGDIAGYERDGRLKIVRLARDGDAAMEFDGGDTSLTPDHSFASAAGRRVEDTWTGEFVLAEEVELDD